jgi:NADPH2:quinone reductase
MAGAELTLPAPLIRSVSLDVRGFSVAHPPVELRREAYLRLTDHAARGDVRVDVERVPLAGVAAAWERQGRAAGGPKTVIVP